MSFTVTWSIEQLKTLDHVSEGFVTRVVYRIDAVDGSAQAHYMSQIEFETPSGTMTPLQDLTEEQVIQWVLLEIGEERVGQIIDNLKTQIGYQLNPPPEPKGVPLPWNPAG